VAIIIKIVINHIGDMSIVKGIFLVMGLLLKGEFLGS
jgi:hypothetical protein